MPMYIETQTIELKVPVNLFKSRVGNTLYASIGINGTYYTGSGEKSYDEAIAALQAEITSGTNKDGVSKNE